MIRLLFIGLIILITTFSCENSEITTGAQGYVTKSPINPVEQAGQINYAPLKAIFHVYTIGGSKVTVFSSNEEGFYQVFLSPGSYKVIPEKNTTIMNPEIQVKEISIESVGFTKIDLSFDTGIR